MRIPNRIIEHPIEAAIASLLLLGLLFSSVDFSFGAKPPESPNSGKMQKL
jgi:hypothetical protein